MEDALNLEINNVECLTKQIKDRQNRNNEHNRQIFSNSIQTPDLQQKSRNGREHGRSLEMPQRSLTIKSVLKDPTRTANNTALSGSQDDNFMFMQPDPYDNSLSRRQSANSSMSRPIKRRVTFLDEVEIELSKKDDKP